MSGSQQQKSSSKSSHSWKVSWQKTFHSPNVEHYAFFLLAMIIFGIARGLFHGVQDNFLAWLGIGKSERGIVEFFRETPGLLLVFILSLFYRMQEQNIIRVAILICMIGVLGMIFSNNMVVPAIIFFVIFNLGDHLIMPVRQSYAIHAAKKGEEGRALGFLGSAMSIGTVAGTLLVAVFFFVPKIQLDRDSGGRLGYLSVYITVILFFILAILLALRMASTHEKLERKRVYFNRKFYKYYILEMFYGARKQVFLTFAPYLLILKYGTGAEFIASLLGVCSLLNVITNPFIGRLIDRIGYRKVMIGDTFILCVVCVLYGFAHRLFNNNVAFVVITITFVLDRIISHASIAASVYVGKISSNRSEIASTLSTGLSVNHLVTVFIALAGGFIWEYFGIELLFSLAAVMAIANSLFAMTLPKREN